MEGSVGLYCTDCAPIDKWLLRSYTWRMITISPEQMAIYRQAADRLAQEDEAQLDARYARANVVAEQAADFLRAHFTVVKIARFGSLVHRQRFHPRSDIDLAVWGLPAADYYRAVGQLQTIDPEFSIDLVRMEDAPPSLRALIEQEGMIV
jgi:predicted nucleotidyltransferase